MSKRRVEVMVVRTVTSLLCRMMLDSYNAMRSAVKVRVRASAKYKKASLPGEQPNPLAGKERLAACTSAVESWRIRIS